MKRILVVEDNSVNRELIQEILETQGFEVVTAGDGQTGVEAALAHKPDLILLDIQMPVMDGFAALEKLRAVPECKNMLIVALTAYAMQNEGDRIDSSGFDGYITKPLNIKDFRSTVAALLNNGSAQG